MISTPFIPVPPPAYGGTELIVGELCGGLRARGHEVILYTTGPGDAPPRAETATQHRYGAVRRRWRYPTPVWPPDPYHELEHVAWALSDLEREHDPVDVIHTHCPSALPLGRFAHTPMVYTLHHCHEEERARFYAMQRDVRFVAISQRQRALHTELPPTHIDVVHHGLDPKRFPLGPGGASCVFLGRLSREKGPHVAIEVARRAGLLLQMAGQPHDGDEDYFQAEVAPWFDTPGVTWLGEVDLAHKLPLLQNARALLFPIDWEEPFGLVMIESMLCGTPVLAFGRGSVSEIVDDGITGFVCRDVAEMSARLRFLDSPRRFDRRRCREHAARRFGRDRMVADYLHVYERAIRSRATQLRPVAEPGSAPLDERDDELPDELVDELLNELPDGLPEFPAELPDERLDNSGAPSMTGVDRERASGA